MNYHDISKDNMLNGDGLRVVLWVAGCEHHCKGCQNPITWDADDGIPFDEEAKAEIYDQLSKDYIKGVTFSGGDPLYKGNRATVKELIENIKRDFPDKDIWLYTGYTEEEIEADTELKEIADLVDVIVVGRFIEELKDFNFHWAGSTNQRVIRKEQNSN